MGPHHCTAQPHPQRDTPGRKPLITGPHPRRGRASAAPVAPGTPCQSTTGQLSPCAPPGSAWKPNTVTSAGHSVSAKADHPSACTGHRCRRDGISGQTVLGAGCWSPGRCSSQASRPSSDEDVLDRAQIQLHSPVAGSVMSVSHNQFGPSAPKSWRTRSSGTGGPAFLPYHISCRPRSTSGYPGRSARRSGQLCTLTCCGLRRPGSGSRTPGPRGGRRTMRSSEQQLEPGTGYRPFEPAVVGSGRA